MKWYTIYIYICVYSKFSNNKKLVWPVLTIRKNTISVGSDNLNVIRDPYDKCSWHLKKKEDLENRKSEITWQRNVKNQGKCDLEGKEIINCIGYSSSWISPNPGSSRSKDSDPEHLVLNPSSAPFIQTVNAGL